MEKDFSPDNIFIYMQIPIVATFVILYIWVAYAGIKWRSFSPNHLVFLLKNR